MPGPRRGIDSFVGRIAPVRTLTDWRRAARHFLAAAGIVAPGVDADLILRHALGLRQVDLPLARDRELTPAERRRLSRLIHQRARRVPLQYVLGTVDFYGLTLRVTPAALIPRPETEGLVEHVVRFLPGASVGPVLDVGTGTGAIALALAAERERLRVWATDLSGDAVRLARQNARRLGLAGRVTVRQGDLTEPVNGVAAPGSWAVVVSNPPYVAPAERRLLAPEVADHEPELALFAAGGGMAVIRRLAPQAARLLAPGGLFALEIGEAQGERVAALLTRAPVWRDVRVEPDLAGRDRYALARRAG
jgi:release factor glutamine methyltransferase